MKHYLFLLVLVCCLLKPSPKKDDILYDLNETKRTFNLKISTMPGWEREQAYGLIEDNVEKQRFAEASYYTIFAADDLNWELAKRLCFGALGLYHEISQNKDSRMVVSIYNKIKNYKKNSTNNESDETAVSSDEDIQSLESFSELNAFACDNSQEYKSDSEQEYPFSLDCAEVGCLVMALVKFYKKEDCLSDEEVLCKYENILEEFCMSAIQQASPSESSLQLSEKRYFDKLNSEEGDSQISSPEAKELCQAIKKSLGVEKNENNIQILVKKIVSEKRPVSREEIYVFLAKTANQADSKALAELTTL